MPNTNRATIGAALTLFVEKGIAETSIKDIARAAKVAQGAMYNHYRSKEQLALQLFLDGWAETGAGLRERAQGAASLET